MDPLKMTNWVLIVFCYLKEKKNFTPIITETEQIKEENLHDMALCVFSTSCP